jgi:hypothetical protein
MTQNVRQPTLAELQRTADFEAALTDIHDAQDRWALAEAAGDKAEMAKQSRRLAVADDAFNEACDREV